MNEETSKPVCLACGAALPPLLLFTGSVRCQDCRDANAPLRVDLVASATHLRAA